jgi:signal peptide peptidase SppA
MPDYRRIARIVREQPWAIEPAYLDLICEVLERRIAGEDLAAEDKLARITAARRAAAPVTAPGSVAVLPLSGVIAPRMGVFDDISGGTSTEGFGQAFGAAVADPNITAIVIDINSPGGSVFGVQELADQIHAARGSKPIVGVAYPRAASAAYWLGAQADELVVTPSGEVGSIGVITAHDDLSAAAEQMGVKRTYITAGKYKAEGNPFEPLGEEARQHLQEQVDAYHDKFVRAVARGRGVSLTKVREDFGGGRMVLADNALAAGMADRTGTLQETIDRLTTRQARAAGARAETEGDRERALARMRLAGAAG